MTLILQVIIPLGTKIFSPTQQMQPSDLEPLGVGFPLFTVTSPVTSRIVRVDLCVFLLHLPQFRGGSICFFFKKFSESLPNNKKRWKKKKGVQQFCEVKPSKFLLKDYEKLIFLPSLKLAASLHLKRCRLTQEERTHLPTMDFQVS